MHNVVMSLVSAGVPATRMPSGTELLLLGLVVFGSVIGLVAQLVLAIFLLLKIRRGATQPSFVLPIIAICVSVVILFCGVAGLILTSGLNLVWSQAGWALLMGCSLTCILWAVVVMTRPSWPAFSLHFVRWVPLLLLALIPVGVLLPGWLRDAGVKGANKRARRHVERTYSGHFLGTDALVFTADGERVFTVSKHDKAPWPSVWNLSSGKRGRGRPKIQVAVSLCFVPGGVVWIEGRPGFRQGRLLYRDTASPGSKPKALGIEHAVVLACTPEGGTVMVGSGFNAGTLTVFRFPGAQRLRQWKVPRIGRHLAISHDGQFIAHGFSGDGRAQIQRLTDGKVVRKVASSLLSNTLSSMALSAKGEYLALGGKNRKLEVWARTGPVRDKPVLTVGAQGKYGSIRLLFTGASNQLVATGGADFVLARWAVGTWKETQRLEHWPDAAKDRCPFPRCLREMPGGDQDRVIVGCGRFADIVNVETGRRLQTLVGLDGPVDAISYSARRGLVGLGGQRQPLAVFHGKTGRRVDQQGTARLTGRAVSLAQSSTAGLVAVGMNNGKLALFEGSEPRLRSVHYPSAGRLCGDMESLTFSADGRFILSADTHGLLRLWSVEKRYPLATETTESKKEMPVALASLGGNAFLVLSQGGDLRRWTIHGQGLKAGKPFGSGCKKGSALAVSQKLDRMAVGCHGGQTRLLSLSTQKKTGATADVHPYGVTALAFDPSGRFLLSGGSYGLVVAWSLPNLRSRGELLSPLRDKSGKVPYLQGINRIVFAPDGKKLVVITQSNHHNIHLLRSTSIGAK